LLWTSGIIPLIRNAARRHYDQVTFYERDGEIVIKPITDEYLQRMAGFTGTKGKLLKALKEEKAKERDL